jgi:hypothetical protein
MKNNGLSLLLILTMLFTSLMLPSQTVSASTNRITVEDFTTMVVKQLVLKVDKNEDKPYIKAAIDAGIIKENEFSDYSKYITRTDASVILVRADEYKYGVTISDELVNTIISKRLSDIEKVKESKRIYVAKAYALGYIKGYSNGLYNSNREFRGSYKLTATGAKELIDMITNKKNPNIGQIAQDGQLLRTTKLPSNSNMYPYILASFPNEFYDWEFRFMKYYDYDGKPKYGTSQWVNLKNYVIPKDVKKFNQIGWNVENVTIEEVYNSVIDTWVDMVKVYLETAFNVDYSTLKKDTKWFDTIVKLDGQYGWKNQKNTEERLNEYIDAAIKNKTVVESSMVAVDGSTLYFSKGYLHLRVYVKYRINSALDVSDLRLSPIVYTNFEYADYSNITLGKWRNGYFDVTLDTNGNGDNGPTKFGVHEIIISDYYYNTRVVK